MAGNAVIYCKQEGEVQVPVTVRIKWLADGTIEPVKYWLPDESCFEIIHIYDKVLLAHLKYQSEGVRFKVRAKLAHIPDHEGELLYSQYEIYLYFADSWFCGKNIIDERYGHTGKEFIHVVLDVFPDCNYELIYFWVREQQYMVEKALETDVRGNFYAGGIGVWHKVNVRAVNEGGDTRDPANNICRQAALYFEINKWFVSISANVE